MEEAVWAVEVLREVGKPVAATMCIGPEGDMHDVTPGECAVKLAQAGKVAMMRRAVQGLPMKCSNLCSILSGE